MKQAAKKRRLSRSTHQRREATRTLIAKMKLLLISSKGWPIKNANTSRRPLKIRTADSHMRKIL